MEEKKFDLNSLIGFVLIGGILIWMLYQNAPSEAELEEQANTEQVEKEAETQKDEKTKVVESTETAAVVENDSLAQVRANAALGGMAACSASGTMAVKYGTMRTVVSGLTVIFPSTIIS